MASNVSSHVLNETMSAETRGWSLKSGRDLNADQAGPGTVDGDIFLNETGEEHQLVLLVQDTDAAVHGRLLARLQIATESPSIRVRGAAEIRAPRPVQANTPVTSVLRQGVVHDAGVRVE